MEEEIKILAEEAAKTPENRACERCGEERGSRGRTFADAPVRKWLAAAVCAVAGGWFVSFMMDPRFGFPHTLVAVAGAGCFWGLAVDLIRHPERHSLDKAGGSDDGSYATSDVTSGTFFFKSESTVYE